MKISTCFKWVLIAALCAGINANLFSQTEITLQPGADGKDARVFSLPGHEDENYSDQPSLNATAWTYSSVAGNMRGYLEFDFSSIPAGAVIIDARLSLYGYTDYAPHHYFTTLNTFLIQRVTEDWDESLITWNNQPASVSANEVKFLSTAFPGQDFTRIDVRNLVQDMIDGGNHGFLIRLETEEKYRSAVFCSGDHADADNHPKIYIKYATESETAPADPGSLTGVYTEGTGVELHWADNATDEARFIVERSSVSNTNYIPLDTLPANTTSFVDNTGATPGKYFYRVKAESNLGFFGQYSNEVNVMVNAVIISNTNANICNGYYYDDGFTEELYNIRSYTHTLYPSENGKMLMMEFEMMDLPSGYKLNIYNGTSTDAELIGSTSGNSIPPALYGTNEFGALTLQQIGASVTSMTDGWRAYVSCLDTLARPVLSDITVTSSAADLTWTINEPTSEYTVIRRSKSGGDWVNIDTVYVSSTFTDTNVFSGTEYSYQVKSWSNGYSSAWSLPYTITTAGPPMPAGLSIDTIGDAFIALQWLDISDKETGYYVSRTTNLNDYFQIIGQVGANETSFKDNTAETGIKYFYRVAAFDATDTSEFTTYLAALTGSVNMFSSASYSRCAYYLLDNGGLNDYTDNANISMNLVPVEAGKKIKLTFEAFKLENSYDKLIITDGETVNHTFTGSSLPAELWAKSNAGSLNLTFTSDGSVTKEGFKIFVKCIEIPDIPVNLSADTVERERIVLNWQDGNGETGYVVQRSVHNTDAFLTIDTIGQDTTTFTDWDVMLGTGYHYRILSFNADVTATDFTDTVLAAVPGPRTPFDFSVDTVGNTMATFSWMHNFNGETGFLLERSANEASGFEPVVSTDIATLTYTETGLTLDTILYYRVRAYDASDTSGYSNTLMINPGGVAMFSSAGYARCGYVLRDPAGRGDYNVNANVSMTLLPVEPGTKVQILFESFATEPGYDYLKVYDGDSLCAALSGVSTPDEIHSTSPSGALKLVFTSDYAINDDGFKLFINCIDVPESPQTLTASNITDSEVTLGWNDMSDNEEGFIIQRSVNDNNNFLNIDTTGADATGYTDITLNSGLHYNYRVVAWNTDGTSGYTNQVHMLSLGAAAPQNLTVTNTDTIVTLQWEDMSPNETGFIVERSVNDDKHFVEWKTTGTDVTTVNDTITDERVIYYRVRATDGTYISAPSDTAFYLSFVKLDNISYTSCGFYLTDYNGMAGYGNSENFTMTLHPDDTTKLVQISFIMFDTEEYYDKLKIYNGDVSSANLIDTYSGNTLPPQITANNPEGKLILNFFSDGSNTGDGFLADVRCVTRPQTPLNISAASDVVSEALLSWDLNTDSVTGYIILQETENAGGYYATDTVDYLVNEYRISGLTVEQSYRFSIQAVRDDVKSFMSDTAEVIVYGMLSPAVLTVQSPSENVINISWEDNSNLEEGYIVYRAVFDEEIFEAVDTLAENTIAFDDEEVAVKTKYLYYVTAYNTDMESITSDTLAIWTNMIELRGYYMLNGVHNAVLVDNGGLGMFTSNYAHYLELFPETGKGFTYEFLSFNTKENVDILQISYGMSNSVSYSGSEVPAGIISVPLDNALILQWDPVTSMQHEGFEIFITQDEVTNVSNPWARKDIQVYPNPFQHELYVHIQQAEEAEAIIELTNIAGQVIHNQNINLLPGQTEYLLSLANVKPGIYFCKVKHQQTETVFRICKE